MATFDVDAVSALLNILEKALGHPKLKPLADAAQKQLEVVAAETAKQLEVEKAEEIKKAETEVVVESEAKKGEEVKVKAVEEPKSPSVERRL